MRTKIVVLFTLSLLVVTSLSFAGGRCGGGGWRGGGYCGPGFGWGGGPSWGWGGWGPSFGISVVTAAPVYRTTYIPATAPAYNSYPSSIIAQTQVQLARMGYYRGAIDGEFGPQTNRAIARYQLDYGLPVTGRVDRTTLRSLGLRV